jgi:hypothetical protein
MGPMISDAPRGLRGRAAMAPPQCSCRSHVCAELSADARRKWAEDEGSKWSWISTLQAYWHFCLPCHQKLLSGDGRSKSQWSCPRAPPWDPDRTGSHVRLCTGDFYLTAPPPELASDWPRYWTTVSGQPVPKARARRPRTVSAAPAASSLRAASSRPCQYRALLTDVVDASPPLHVDRSPASFGRTACDACLAPLAQQGRQDAVSVQLCEDEVYQRHTAFLCVRCRCRLYERGALNLDDDLDDTLLPYFRDPAAPTRKQDWAAPRPSWSM